MKKLYLVTNGQQNPELFLAATIYIMKTRLFKYIENFTTKKGKFSNKKF